MNAKRKQRKSKEKIEHIPKDVVAYYLPSPNSTKKIYFTRDTILLMYHIIRLRYFSREMILDQYYILTGKELNNRTLYSFIGNSRMPLSHFEDNYRIGKTKFLYVPKYFADWLLDIIHEIPGLTELTKVTEFKGSHYSLKTNKMIGGKDGIRKIHLHDYHTRRLALKIGRRIVEQCTDLSPRELNITYFFRLTENLFHLSQMQ